MSMWRLGAAVGIVAGLAMALVILLAASPSEVEAAPIWTSTARRPSTSTTASLLPTTVTTAGTTTTTSATDRIEQVTAIIRELYFGWFDAIYRKDPDSLWAVVATRQYHENGVKGMHTLDFVAAPTREGIDISNVDILLDRPDCLVVYSEPDFTAFRGPGAVTHGVHVLWPTEGRWRFATAWWNKVDLWINDCDLRERPVVP